jgi:antitoxin component of RelBE/YafQ-DinJ toxin-antitoxin module
MRKSDTTADLKGEFQRNGMQMGMRNPFAMIKLAVLAGMVSVASLANAQDSVHSCMGVGGGGAPGQKGGDNKELALTQTRYINYTLEQIAYNDSISLDTRMRDPVTGEIDSAKVENLAKQLQRRKDVEARKNGTFKTTPVQATPEAIPEDEYVDIITFRNDTLEKKCDERAPVAQQTNKKSVTTNSSGGATADRSSVGSGGKTQTRPTPAKKEYKGSTTQATAEAAKPKASSESASTAMVDYIQEGNQIGTYIDPSCNCARPIVQHEDMMRIKKSDLANLQPGTFRLQ